MSGLVSKLEKLGCTAQCSSQRHEQDAHDSSMSTLGPLRTGKTELDEECIPRPIQRS